MSRVLVLSTYDLGTQPTACARLTSRLSDAGHDVRQVDLSVQDWPTTEIAWADAIACSVPMHTALRLGLQALARIRAQRSRLPFAFFGLYAPVATRSGILEPSDLAAAGDVDDAVCSWLVTLGSPSVTQDTVINLGPVRRVVSEPSPLPRRSDLPGLSSYARLISGEEERLVGSLETSHGCNHTCLHCPVPVVYRGRSRPIDESLVADDIAQLVAMGAEHIHFGDPDFLNRPRHSLEIARRLHAEHPDVSFDATIKVSHILWHREIFAELARCGLSFVVSAFESTSDVVLSALSKGHTGADEPTALAILRAHGIEIRPSFLPFTPWTTREDMIDLLAFVAEHDLVWNVDPVQYGVRLLLPPGSLLLDQPDAVLERALGDYQPAELGYSWRSDDALLDDLALELAALTEKAATEQAPIEDTYDQVRAHVHARLGRVDTTTARSRATEGRDRPRLSESWFCCAEPTGAQLAVIAPQKDCDEHI